MSLGLAQGHLSFFFLPPAPHPRPPKQNLLIFLFCFLFFFFPLPKKLILKDFSSSFLMQETNTICWISEFWNPTCTHEQRTSNLQLENIMHSVNIQPNLVKTVSMHSNTTPVLTILERPERPITDTVLNLLWKYQSLPQGCCTLAYIPYTSVNQLMTEARTTATS